MSVDTSLVSENTVLVLESRALVSERHSSSVFVSLPVSRSTDAVIVQVC